MCDRILTPRELEAAKLAAQGDPNKVMAKKMNVTEGTVKQYLYRVYEKLGVENRTELQAKGITKVI